MEASKLCANISLSLVSLVLISGCTSSVKPRTIGIHAGYWVGNKKIDVKDVDCEVQVGKTKYNVNIPSYFEVTPKKDDNLYVYCQKSGYVMVKNSSFNQIYQQPKSLIKTRLFYNSCSGSEWVMYGIFYFVPIPALVFQESRLFFIPLVIGGLDFAFTAIADAPYQKGYRYHFESIDITMLPNELLKDTDKLVERTPKGKPQKISEMCSH